MKKYSELRDPKRPALERLLPLDFPLSLFIETTNRCNFRCRYCPMSFPEYARIAGGLRTMSVAQFDKICNDIKKGGKVKVIRFYLMGEPLLNRHVPQMIKKVCQLKLAQRTELTTNATLLNSRKARAIIDSGLDYLRVSISAVDNQRHKTITRTGIRVDQIYAHIKRFKQIRDEIGQPKPFLYVKMLDSGSDSENTKFLRMYKDIADEAALEKPMNWDSYGGYNLLDAAYKKKQRFSEKQLYPYPKEVCPYPFYTLAINVNGEVTVCCVDWNKATCIGNVFKDSLKSIWQGKVLRDLRRLHIGRKRKMNSSCRHCKFLFTTPDNLDHMPESKIMTILGPDKM